MSKNTTQHTVVIGGGIVGVCGAFELARSGHQVTLLDLGELGGQQSSSYGHGCWISPASVVPMSMPGLWKQVPGYLFNPDGPLVIRWRYILKLAPWLLRFLFAGSSVKRVEATAKALNSLLNDSPNRHVALSEAVGAAELIRNEGLLYVYSDKQAFEKEALSWHLRKITGLQWKELDREQLGEREPGLDDHYRFGVFVENGAHCVDPAAYVARIGKAAMAHGVRVVQAKATGFEFDGAHLRAVMTTVGLIECDHAVVAAGAWSKVLARQSGDRIPLESERGYHGVISLSSGGPLHPVMPNDGKMANTPTLKGLRLSGQVELASLDAPPNWNRVDILVSHARKTYPALSQRQDLILEKWMGHRPSTPDGLPVIGASSRSPDIFYAFGHGHVGFASGPITGRLVADYFTQSGNDRDISAFSPRRFK